MKKVFTFFLLLLCVSALFSQTTDTTAIPEAEPYAKEEFPFFVNDLRRTEIITFGSYPFTTLGVSAGYSIFRYFSNNMNEDYFPNPFAKNSSAANLSSDEQKIIMLGAAGISLGIGVADFIVTKILQGLEYKNALEVQEAEMNDPDITIIPIYKDSGATE